MALTSRIGFFGRLRFDLLASALACASFSLPTWAQQPAESMLFPLDPVPAEATPPETVKPEETSLPQDFPASLAGETVGTVLNNLRAEGWTVVARTPHVVQLNKGNQGLDLAVEAATGKVISAQMVNL